jgi:hypothetical protein
MRGGVCWNFLRPASKAAGRPALCVVFVTRRKSESGTSATCGDRVFRSAYKARAVARPMPPRRRSVETFQAADRLFWFTRNRLAGSYFLLSVARRL